MSAPNEFIPPTSHAFHHENIAPLVIQAAHSSSNFPATTNANGAHFNGSGFFPNSIGYDVAMLPFLHHTSQRPAHFNTFAHQKQTIIDNTPKEDISQIPAPPDGRANVFNTESTNSPSPIQSAYWSRQSQLSPFGVLPHEISPEHIDTDANAMNAHFASPAVNNLSAHLPSNNCVVDRDKKTPVIVSGKSKDTGNMKKYIPKPVNDVKIQNAAAILPNNYHHEDIGYRNGVINHGGQATMNKVNTSYNKSASKPANEIVEPLQVANEPVNTVPRDYRVFKSPGLFPNSSVPVVKFTGKPSKQYLHKQMVNSKSPQNMTAGVAKNHRINSKMSDFQDDAQSSPISLTSDDISDHRSHYASPSEVVRHNNLKESENEQSFHGMAQLNNNVVSHTNSVSAPPPGYREQQLQDINCQDKNKVTPPFLKLPYAAGTGNGQNNVVAADRNRTSFPPLYIMYNNPPPSLIATPKRQTDKPERGDVQHAKMNVNVTHTPESSAPANMIMSKAPLQNGMVGYSSVIMRTDRNYEAEEKMDKLPRRMLWNDRQIAPTAVSAVKSDKLVNYNPKDNTQGNVQASIPEHHHLLLGLTERQHSYFDTTPCPAQINTPNMSNAKCVAKPISKNMYDDGQRLPEPHPQVTQPPESVHHYQQYMPVNSANKTPIPINQPVEPPHPDAVEKPYQRKRKSSKINNTPHMTNLPAEYPGVRDPPPAHHSPYQQPIQNSNYMMEGARYEIPPHSMTKMYPSNEQFYAQPNINAYNVNAPANVTHEPPHQHQTVISSHTNTPPSRHSPSTQLRNVPPIPPALPLSAYFSSFHSGGSHYPPHHEFATGADSTPYSVPPETQHHYQPESTNKLEKEVYDNRSKVIVPNVEEEFRFLFDPSTPNYKQIAWSAEENELLKKAAASKSMFYRKNIDFLASYIKFLENNCESVETLTDSNSSTIKTWNRNKVVYQPIVRDNKDEDVTPPAPLPPKDPPKPKEPETNFENDPRYYPLPKSSDKRRLDSSSDESADEFVKKSKPSGGKKSSNENKKLTPRKEQQQSKTEKKNKKEIKKAKIIKKESDDESHEKEPKTVKTKLEKLEKAKQKIAKLQMKVEKKKHKADKIKPKMEKAIAEIKAIKQSGMVQKPKTNKETAKESKSVPRRKVSDRKAKDEFMLKQKIQGAIDSEDELHTDSDSDPSWTPRADDEENVSKRKSTRIRSVRFKSKTSKKSDSGSFKQNFTGSSKKEGSNAALLSSARESNKNSKGLESCHKMKPFYILKKEANTKHPNVWRLQDENRLQKFEYVERDGRHLYRNSSEFCKFSENDRSKYQEVEVTVVEDKNDKTIIELSDDTEIPTDVKIKENFMKESLCYEHQFAVYIQTLVSQALDSNFLSEIAKENDVYFLNNMKVIDEVTATYLSDLSGVVKWGSSSVNILVKTWPFLSIKNIRNESTKGGAKCSSCGNTNAKQTAIFYGQPYQRETLQGCKPNSSIPNDIDKTVDLCKSCARETKLFNKIWHQKYHVFIECAKYVSKKKTEDKTKGTTDILNELLADTTWLSKLFYDIRNNWLQIWTIVQKMKES